MARAYDVLEVEKKWQQRWADEGTYEVDADDPRPPWYVLTMYPYPSGPAHMGHVRNYTFGDLLVRHRTMLGYAVLSPFGFDSFGLPAENAAIQTGTHPRVFTDARIAELKESVISLGAVYDWRREIRSHDPEYMRWNQVIFQQFLAAGLAYRANAPVNWCPGCQTVLANEQVLADGTCERSGDLVGQAQSRAVVLPASPSTPTSSWPIWTPWTGPSGSRPCSATGSAAPRGPSSTWWSRGATAPTVRERLALRVFTTRPDTSFGMTYAVVAPEHPLVDALTTPEHRAEVDELRARAAASTDVERMSESGAASLARRGAFTGSSVINPFTRRPVPVYVADYVLMGYGTGAIMAVPAEDTRDWDFAQAYGLPVVRTVRPPDGWDEHGGPDGGPGGAYTGAGEKINSEWLNGLDDPDRQGPGHRLAGGGGHRQAHRQLPAARLAGLPPAVLGMPDTHRVLPRPRHRPGARGPTAGAGPRRCGVPAHRSVTAGHQPGVPAHHLPDLRGPGHPRDRHHGHLRRLVVVLPPLHRPMVSGSVPSIRRSPATGCRSTSTSAGSSTPSSTCSTPASSPRRWPTSGWLPTSCASRSPATTPRG